MRQRIMLLCATLLMALMPAIAKTYIVSVGIADYPGSQNDLSNCVVDAESVAWLFTRNDAGNVEGQLLKDSQATCSAIVRTMQQVFSQAGPDDTVIFFYSGHGYEGGFVAYDGRLDYSSMRAPLMASRAKNKLILADACFAGMFRDDANAALQQSDARRANVMLFLSSRSNETSIERPSMTNGYFTTYLVRGLRGRADRNRNRVVTARELFEYVQEGVVNLSQGRQHPVMWGNFDDNMPVIVWPRGGH